MSHDKKKDYQIYRMPKGMRQVHRDYGLWICHTGSYSAPVDGFSKCPERYFEYFSISHCYDGGGRLWLPPDQESDIKPGDCVIIPPGQVNRYGGNGTLYVEDSVCFTGPVANRMFDAGMIKCGIFDLGMSRKLLRVRELASGPSRDEQLEANFELQRILFDIWRRNRCGGSEPGTDPVLLLRLEIMENPAYWWTVANMAEYCKLSKDQFRRRFEKHTGMKPKEFLDNVKMRRAAELLSDSDLTISEVSERLGYVDPFHFSRRFKAVIGMPPKQYRRQFGPAGNL